MEVEDFKVKGKHNLQLACIRVLPKKAPKAVIQIFHGMGEYKNRYIPFMDYLAENGFAVYAHDHRKHGESIEHEDDYGILLPTDTWDDIIDDCYFVSRKILKDFPGVPIVVLGHSMGSIICRSFLGKYPTVPSSAIIMGTLPPYSLTKALAPLVLSSIIKTFSSKTKRSNFLAELLNKGMQPKYGMPRTPFDWLSKDDDIVDKYIADPLCGYAYTPQFYNQFFKGIIEVNKSNFISLMKDIPILLISGQEDPVGEKGVGVNEVYKVLVGHGLTQLTLKLIEEGRHEILNETDKLSTYEYILDWIVKSLEA